MAANMLLIIFLNHFDLIDVLSRVWRLQSWTQWVLFILFRQLTQTQFVQRTIFWKVPLVFKLDNN